MQQPLAQAESGLAIEHAVQAANRHDFYPLFLLEKAKEFQEDMDKLNPKKFDQQHFSIELAQNQLAKKRQGLKKE